MKEKMDPELKKLVLWRIETGVPEYLKLSIGNKGTFSKEEMKHHIQVEDDVGVELVKMQLNFIKALSSGKLSKLLAE